MGSPDDQHDTISLQNISGSIQGNEEAPLLASVESKPRYPWWRILLLTIGMFGMEFPWSFEYTFYTPTLRELGVSSWVASYAWIFSPVAAILFVPLFGTISDKINSPIGRRSPFIIITAIVSCTAMLIIPFTVPVGQTISSNSNTLAEILVVIAYLVLDFSNKIYEEMLRVLISTVLPGSQLAVGNAWFTALSGLGSAMGYLFGFIKLSEVFMYGVGILVFVPCAIISLVAAREKRYVPTEKEAMQRKNSKGISGLIRTFKSFPLVFYLLIVAQLASWMGLWPLWTYVSDWMGEEIFNGDPSAPSDSPEYEDYIDGVHAGSLANGLAALVNVAFSFIVTPLARKVGMKLVYILCQATSGVSFVLCFWVTNEYVAIVLIAAQGFSWSVNATFPYVILCNYIEQKDRGLAVGLIYVTSITAQIIVVVGFGYSTSLYDGVSITLLLAGLCSLLGVLLSTFIPMVQPDEHTDSKLV